MPQDVRIEGDDWITSEPQPGDIVYRENQPEQVYIVTRRIYDNEMLQWVLLKTGVAYTPGHWRTDRGWRRLDAGERVVIEE